MCLALRLLLLTAAPPTYTTRSPGDADTEVITTDDPSPTGTTAGPTTTGPTTAESTTTDDTATGGPTCEPYTIAV